MNDNLARMYQDSQRQMREALEAVEWVSEPSTGAAAEYAFCPWCGNYHDDGHRFDCQRQAALGEKVESA